MKSPMLKTVRVRNFKAIRDSGILKLTPLTVLIGNNGSGKSSLIEALQTYQLLLTDGLDEAFARWHGIQFVRNKSAARQRRYSRKTGRARAANAIELDLSGHTGGYPFRTRTVLNDEEADEYLVIQREEIHVGGTSLVRDETGRVSGGIRARLVLPGVRSAAADERLYGMSYVAYWQFLNLTPAVMGEPRARSRVRARVRLATDGANLAEYLMDIRRRDTNAFAGILGALQHVLRDTVDLQPIETSELERTVHLRMKEQHFEVPGWLLSTGTLRIVALIAVLRDPTPPPLVIIEEIENGLDPRTIHLLVEELQRTVEGGRSQVIVTTHSPYLLDLLPLSSIVLVDRVEGEPRFRRPADDKGVREWAKQFAPGHLYTMGRLGRGAQ